MIQCVRAYKLRELLMRDLELNFFLELSGHLAMQPKLHETRNCASFLLRKLFPCSIQTEPVPVFGSADQLKVRCAEHSPKRFRGYSPPN
jgi:hypothetical protein